MPGSGGPNSRGTSLIPGYSGDSRTGREGTADPVLRMAGVGGTHVWRRERRTAVVPQRTAS